MVKASSAFSASLSAQIYSVNLRIETHSEKHMLLVFFMNNICVIKSHVRRSERVRLLSFMHFSPCFPLGSMLVSQSRAYTTLFQMKASCPSS